MHANSSSFSPSIPLFYEQIREQEKNVVETLLRAGADPNTADDNWGGATPVHNIASDQELEILSLLFDFNANPNAQTNDGATPLVFCALVAVENATIHVYLKHRMF